jgi:hypothetical protein
MVLVLISNSKIVSPRGLFHVVNTEKKNNIHGVLI